MSTLIKRLSQNGTQFVPITLSEAVVVNTSNTLLSQLGITTLDKVLRTTFGLIGNSNSEINTLKSLVETINSELLNKQDKLTAGSGIKIENGIISAELNTTLYKIVTELPLNPSSEHLNQIYLLAAESGVGGNHFKEFICVQHNGYYVWEEIGTVQTEVDLSGYITKDEFNTQMGLINSEIANIKNNIANLDTIQSIDVTTSTGATVIVNYDIPINLYDDAVSNDQQDYIQ